MDKFIHNLNLHKFNLNSNKMCYVCVELIYYVKNYFYNFLNKWILSMKIFRKLIEHSNAQLTI